MASLATAGCFLVGNYEISEQIRATSTSTDDENDPDTSPVTSADVNHTTTTDADASVASGPATGDTSASDTNVDTFTDIASSTEDSASTSDEPTSATTTLNTTTTLESLSNDPASSGDAADAGASTEAVSTAAPVCPNDTEYDAEYELCVYPCDDGARNPSGRCYWVGTERMPWEPVIGTCAERGAGWNVLTVRSDAEHTFVISILEEDTWLGASDEETDDQWFWLDDDTQFWQGQENGNAVNGEFEAWATDEPSAANDEQCARYHLSSDRSTWAWSDCACGPEGGNWGGGNGGNWGGNEDEQDVYVAACKGPAAIPPT